jgi:hypothetical protein
MIAYNSKSLINYLKRKFPFFNGNFKEKMNEFINFYNFICANNPLIIDYSDKKDEILVIKNIDEITKKQELKFEDKYLEKMKNLSNEFSFTKDEEQQESKEYLKIKMEYEKNRLNEINSIQSELFKIHDIEQKGINDKNINEYGIKKLIKFFDLEEDYQEDPTDIDIEELYKILLKNKEELLQKMNDIEKTTILDEELHMKARDTIINNKLDKFINNYVLEYTPLGNVYMRYNNNKKSFEYYSNNTIPYRYLEPIARKYVITYFCKPIFIDIEEELKKAEEKYDDLKKKREEVDKKQEELKKNNPKQILAQLKTYNNQSKDMSSMPMKNRQKSNSVLPSQLKVNLPDVNKSSGKQLLKENANRYTWEGRLANFCPLKKIDKKLLDKNLTITYADFKKIQNDKQNKKIDIL